MPGMRTSGSPLPVVVVRMISPGATWMLRMTAESGGAPRSASVRNSMDVQGTRRKELRKPAGGVSLLHMAFARERWTLVATSDLDEVTGNRIVGVQLDGRPLRSMPVRFPFVSGESVPPVPAHDDRRGPAQRPRLDLAERLLQGVASDDHLDSRADRFAARSAPVTRSGCRGGPERLRPKRGK